MGKVLFCTQSTPFWTEGKFYTVNAETEQSYIITNDFGVTHYVSKEPDYRGVNYKSWFILIDDIENYGLNKAYYQVKEFHEAFGHPVAEKPTPMEVSTAIARQIWKAEEIVEFLHATARGQEDLFKMLVNELINGIRDAADKQLKKEAVYETDEDVLVAQADALTDINYFNQGDFVVMGVKPQSLFDIVQRANMGKLWEDGKPRYREDGKIMKPENWERDFAPEKRLREEIARQKCE